MQLTKSGILLDFEANLVYRVCLYEMLGRLTLLLKKCIIRIITLKGGRKNEYQQKDRLYNI